MSAQKIPAVRLKDSVIRDSAAASMEDFQCKDQTVHSYQQISCLDSVIRLACVLFVCFFHMRLWLNDKRVKCELWFKSFSFLRYLESCNIPITVKRKYQFSSNTTSSNSDDDKKGSEEGIQVPQDTNTGVFSLKIRLENTPCVVILIFALLYC